MPWVPSFKLYASDGSTLLYTFTAVQDFNAPGGVINTIAISNFRGAGGVIIPGGNKIWELTISFVLLSDGYTNVAQAVDNLESTIVSNTPYIIRIDETPTTYFNQASGGYKVKRTKPFDYTNRSQDLMNDIQRVTAHFDVNAWG